ELEMLEAAYGSLLPRAILFSLVMLLCLLAFGLYSARQRARIVGLFIRGVAALAAAVSVIAAVLHILPWIWIVPRVVLLAAAGAVPCAALLRLLFYRVVEENLFKRRVLVYGAGLRATPIARLRRRSDRRGFVVIGFVQADGEACALPSQQLLDRRPGLA